MKQNRVNPIMMLTLAGFVTLALSAGIDYLIRRLEFYTGRTFEF